MRALVYADTCTVEMRDTHAPEPSGTDVLIAVDAVGICGSDMHAYLGHDPRRVPPLVLGHEAAGTIVGGDRAGERVVLNPLITCGQCRACLSGRSNLCADRDLIGMYRPGAFSEYVAMPERNLIPIPAGMSPVHAALTEPAATAVHAVNLAARASHRPLAECRALVLGGGSVGLFAALALADHGVTEVQLAETNALRRATAQTAGVSAVIDPSEAAVPGDHFDVVVDAVGGRASREYGSAAVRVGGVFMHIGLMDNDGGLDMRRVTLSEITVVGTYTYTHLDMQVTLDKLHRGVFGDLAWVKRRPLASGAEAFDDLRHGRSAAPNIVLEP